MMRFGFASNASQQEGTEEMMMARSGDSSESRVLGGSPLPLFRKRLKGPDLTHFKQ